MMTISKRTIVLYSVVALLLALNIYYTNLWFRTITWKDTDNATIRNTYAEGYTIFQAKPWEMVTYGGWGKWFQWNLIGLAIITALYLLEGAPKSRLYEIQDPLNPSETRFDFKLIPRWKNLLGGYMPVELRLPSLIWILASDIFMLAVVGTGAYMALFWDFQHQTPWYLWHCLAHGFIAAVVMNKVLSINIRGIFGCSWRWQEFICYLCAWLGSMWNEAGENLVALVYGQLPSMNNILPDTVGDHIAVMVAAIVMVRIFIAIQYHD